MTTPSRDQRGHFLPGATCDQPRENGRFVKRAGLTGGYLAEHAFVAQHAPDAEFADWQPSARRAGWI